MKSKTLILLVVAGVCGLVASYMTSRFLASQNEKVQVLVAKGKLGAGSFFKNPEEQFDLEERLKTDVPRNAVTSTEGLKDQILMKTLEKGEVLVTDYVKNKSEVGLEVVLPSGKRAVAVRTTAEAVAGGFVLPGSHVDVIHTVRRGDREPDSKVVLQNILVRATDLSDRRPDDRAGVVPATVTLEVTPEEALVLARVKDVGSITLSLRPLGDGELVETELPKPPEPPKSPELPKPDPAVVAEVKPPEPPKPEVKTMLIYNSGQLTRATFSVQDGEVKTSVDRSQLVDVPPPPPPPPPAVAPSSPTAPREAGAAPAQTK
jgi:Flp pilus assembly protein CpaB